TSASLQLTKEALDLTREHDRLSTRPKVAFSRSPGLKFGSTGEQGILVTLTNEGLGPAQVRWSGLYLDGVAQRSWAQFFTTLGAKQHQGTYFQIGRSFWLKEGSLIDLLREERTDSAAPFNIAFNQGRIDFRICYCSLYDECWMSWIQNIKPREDTPIKDCPPEDLGFS